MTGIPVGGLAVIVGSSGGIGEAVQAEAEKSGLFQAVVGLSRASEPELDLLDERSIKSAAAHVKALGLDVRLIFDATGFLKGNGFKPEKSLSALDPAHLAHAFAINAAGPALLMKHFLPLLPSKGKSVFVTLSAKVGSIGDNELGGWYSYRASKAALNQLVHTAAIELKRRRPHAVCAVLHPGTVDTGLSKGFAKSGLTVRTPAEAAAMIFETVMRLEPSGTGGFWTYDGENLPW